MPESVVENPANPKWMVWTGRVLSALPVPVSYTHLTLPTILRV